MNTYVLAKRGGDDLMYYVFSPSDIWKLVQSHHLEGFVYDGSFDASEAGLKSVQVLIEDWPALLKVLRDNGFHQINAPLPFYYERLCVILGRHKNHT